jgi:hypothetical protein
MDRREGIAFSLPLVYDVNAMLPFVWALAVVLFTAVLLSVDD